MPRARTGAKTPDAGNNGHRRTRGGWDPVGTAADRRANHATKGTARGQRTRNKLIQAARTVFERIGYFDASVDDIVAEAGVARGSFYTYFEDKLDIFRVLSLEVHNAVGEAVSTGLSRQEGSDPIARLHQSNLKYIETYREYAALYGLVEQVATIDADMQATRIERRRIHVERVTAFIERWQQRGQADPTIDAPTTAALLVSMTSNFCYWWFVTNEEHDLQQASKALTQTWVNAIGLRRQTEEVQTEIV